jgi:hypothetical protein
MECAPQVLVVYNREAWCAPEDDSVRVTFDRALEAAPYDPEKTFRLQRDEQWITPIMRYPGVVLELKFTDRFPNWMRQMVQTYNLFRTSMAKYVTCAMAMAPDGTAAVRDLEAAKELIAAQRWEESRRQEREREGAPRLPLATPPSAPMPKPTGAPWGAAEAGAGAAKGLVHARGGINL